MQNFVVIEFQVSFVEFPQQETKIKVEFTIERKMLSSSNIHYIADAGAIKPQSR